MVLFSPGDFGGTNPIIENKYYSVKVAETQNEIKQACRLRFEVFNLELGEGLATSFKTGVDTDSYDEQFYHLIIINKLNNEVVATYRVQDYAAAQQGLGFYSAERFNFDDYPLEVQRQALETGRACIARNFRNSSIFGLLWKGLAQLMLRSGIRYFFGCGSIPSQNPQDANDLIQLFQTMSVYHKNIYIEATDEFYCPYEKRTADISKVQLPLLFSIYLRFNCEICSAPCFDREFSSIDFLLMLDSQLVPRRTLEYFV